MASVIQPEHFKADLHEAKDLQKALTALAPENRIRWLRVCCAKVSVGSTTRLDVVSSDGTVIDVLIGFWSICGQGGLTLEWATAFAENMVRRDTDRLLEQLQGVSTCQH